MITRFKRQLVSLVSKQRVGRKCLDLYRFSYHLTEIGWFESNERQIPVDCHGEPLPWYTYAAIHFLENRVRPQMRVFEYGSGNSTLWWSKRVTSVVSVEHDLTWFQKLREVLPANVEYTHCELAYGGQYSSVSAEYGRCFDIIVIDGRDRVNCAKNSLGVLTESGIVIWDNSDRKSYSEGYDFLAKKGFSRLDFYGYGPLSFVGSCTSIFYRDNNCFEI